MTKHVSAPKVAPQIKMDMPMANGQPTSLEVVEALDEFMQAFEAFEAFKQTNDERLAQIERQVSSDVVTDEPH